MKVDEKLDYKSGKNLAYIERELYKCLNFPKFWPLDSVRSQFVLKSIRT